MGYNLSIQAMAWAIEQQDISDPHARFVLLSLANAASPVGENAFPSISRICRDTGLSESTVRRCLQRLEQCALIVRGNQAIAAAYINRVDRRPTVYNLVMSGVSAGHPDERTGCQPDANGVSARRERGVTVTPNPILRSVRKPKSVETAWAEEFEQRFGRKPKGAK